MNQELADKELGDVFDLLEQILDSIQKTKKRRNRSLKNIEGMAKWEERSLIGLTFSISVCIVIEILLASFRENLFAWLTQLLVWVEIALLWISVFFWLLYAALIFLGILKGLRESTRIYAKRIKEDALITQQAATRLSRLARITPKTLESARLHFELEIEEVKAREKVSNSLLILAVLVVFGIWFLGVPDKFLRGDPLRSGIALTSGLVAVSSLVVKSLSTLMSQSRITHCKRRLSLLEQAQAIANNEISVLSQQLNDPAFPDITYRRGESGQLWPVLSGTGLRVQAVVVAAQQWSLSPNQIATEYGLSEAQVSSALVFYKAHTSEIDAAIAAEQTFEAANV